MTLCELTKFCYFLLILPEENQNACRDKNKLSIHISTKHDSNYAHNYHFHSSSSGNTNNVKNPFPSVKGSVTLSKRICYSFHKESTHSIRVNTLWYRKDIQGPRSQRQI